MDDEDRAKLIASAMREVDILRFDPRAPRQTWWLSFADGDLPKGKQFLGVVVVPDCVNMADALSQVHQAGINPGGEVQGMSLEGISPEGQAVMDRTPKLTLLSAADLTALGHLK